MTGLRLPLRAARAGWSPVQRIALLTSVVAAVAVGLFVVGVLPAAGTGAAPAVGMASGSAAPWVLWVVAFAVAEVLVVHIQFERDAHSFSLTDLVLVTGLFLAAPTQLVTAQVLGAGLTLLLHRRQPWLKLAFNLAQYALGGCLAVIVFTAVADPAGGFGLRSWAEALAAVLVSTVVADLSIFVVISLSTGRADLQRVPQMLALSLPNAAGSVTAVRAVTDPAALALLAVPALLITAAYRAYTSSREQQDNLRLLHEVSSLLHHGNDADDAVSNFLTSVRAAFRSEAAELILLGGSGSDVPTVSSAREGQPPRVMDPLEDVAAHEQLVRRATLSGMLAFRTGSRRGGQLEEYAAGRGFTDAMVSVLRTDDRVHGLLLVAGRQGDIGTFTGSDLALLETFARHLGTSLERGRLEHNLRQVTDLKEQLRHQTLHDPLTGLPNRTLFLDRARHSISGAIRSRAWPAVLYLDLDQFKPVNDRYGHDAGDLMLRTVATRLRGCLRPGDTAARLAGDEFAVLLDGPIDEATVARVVDRIRQQLAVPVDLGDGRLVTPAVSIGVAIGRAGLPDADTLIRQADTAMYAAKRAGGNAHAVYQPGVGDQPGVEHDPAAELAAALRDGELSVVYQPIVDLHSGRPVGAEALAETGLAPEHLVLEITETALMHDREAAAATLWQLKLLGVAIAIDDFGTGYSSLAYLRRFPIDLLKIAREFVDGLGLDAHDDAITRAIVELAGTLGLRTVAEGIETEQQLDHVRALRCDLAQGYLFSRPVPAAAMVALMAPSGPGRPPVGLLLPRPAGQLAGAG